MSKLSLIQNVRLKLRFFFILSFILVLIQNKSWATFHWPWDGPRTRAIEAIQKKDLADLEKTLKDDQVQKKLNILKSEKFNKTVMEVAIESQDFRYVEMLLKYRPDAFWGVTYNGTTHSNALQYVLNFKNYDLTNRILNWALKQPNLFQFSDQFFLIYFDSIVNGTQVNYFSDETKNLLKLKLSGFNKLTLYNYRNSQYTLSTLLYQVLDDKSVSIPPQDVTSAILMNDEWLFKRMMESPLLYVKEFGGSENGMKMPYLSPLEAALKVCFENFQCNALKILYAKGVRPSANALKNKTFLSPHRKNNSNSMLMENIQQGLYETVKILVDLKIDLNYINPKNHESAFSYAFKNQRLDYVKMLINAGIDKSIINVNDLKFSLQPFFDNYDEFKKILHDIEASQKKVIAQQVPAAPPIPLIRAKVIIAGENEQQRPKVDQRQLPLHHVIVETDSSSDNDSEFDLDSSENSSEDSLHQQKNPTHFEVETFEKLALAGNELKINEFLLKNKLSIIQKLPGRNYSALNYFMRKGLEHLAKSYLSRLNGQINEGDLVESLVGTVEEPLYATILPKVIVSAWKIKPNMQLKLFKPLTHWLIETDQLEVFEEILNFTSSAQVVSNPQNTKFKLDLDKIDVSTGKTLLMMLLERGKLNLAKTLVELGANMNTLNSLNRRHTLSYLKVLDTPESKNFIEWWKLKNPNGVTPLGNLFLTEALRKRDHDSVRKLIDAKADVNKYDVNLGKTPLMVAIEALSEEMVTFLLEKGAYTNFHTPLGMVDAISLLVGNTEKHKNIRSKLMLTNPNGVLPSGTSFLSNAIKNSDEKLVSELLIAGANVNYVDAHFKETAFEMALKLKNLKILKWLLDFGVNIPGYVNLPQNQRDATFKFVSTYHDKKIRKVESLKEILRLTKLPYWENTVGMNCLVGENSETYKLLLKMKEVFQVAQQDFHSQTACMSCSDHIHPDETYARLEGCNCPMHKECLQGFVQMLTTKNAQEIAKCPIHKHQELHPNFLSLTGVGVTQLANYQRRVVEGRLAAIPGFKLCPTENCLGGKVVAEGKSENFECPFCEKSSVLGNVNHNPLAGGGNRANMQSEDEIEMLLKFGREPYVENAKEGDKNYLYGRYRPCYWCGVMNELADGCNAVTCKSCKERFHWNYGDFKKHPLYNGDNHNVHDWKPGHMRYVPLSKPCFYKKQ
jgi:ankyrin repeat protein